MSTIKRNKTIFFDLFGVLISFDDNLVTQRIARYCSSPEKAASELVGVVSRETLIRGKLSLEELHAELVQRLGLTLDAEDFHKLWLEPYSKPMPGMQDVLKALSEKYQLVLISNVDKYYWGGLRSTLRELEQFHHMIVSCEVGVAKPDHKMFELALQRADCAAADGYFVDDKITNIDAARKMGIDGHQFTSTVDLMTALRNKDLL